MYDEIEERMRREERVAGYAVIAAILVIVLFAIATLSKVCRSDEAVGRIEVHTISDDPVDLVEP